MCDHNKLTCGVVKTNLSGIHMPLLTKNSDVQVWFKRFELALDKLKIKPAEWVTEMSLLCDEPTYKICKLLKINASTEYSEAKFKITSRLSRPADAFRAQYLLHSRPQEISESIEDYADGLL
ncbi:hypothetical protein RF11_10053 [Thelohanellus kitauei]|uniref:Uncharacterized protein n=1 Tax=Thelohanellus kitauei TaxID=669202 RepID=A0A0C2MMQ7_THEKT|nr:hypothetical protein RF11_10053 [Thelohanellus kitauei]